MTEREPQVAAYRAFGDALDAAGRARAAGRADSVREHLGDAGRAGLEVFRQSGTLDTTIHELDTGESDTFIDRSAANPATYVLALYAALAAGDEQTVQRLVDVEFDAPDREQVVTSPALDAVPRALREVLTRGEHGLRALLDELAGSHGEGDRYWIAQLEALAALGEGESYERALERVEAAERRYYDADSPEAALLLPVLGLRAIAARHVA